VCIIFEESGWSPALEEGCVGLLRHAAALLQLGARHPGAAETAGISAERGKQSAWQGRAISSVDWEGAEDFLVMLQENASCMGAEET
jgi:hypothetical protein